jgi:beta-N-acetylhexosaminidase
MQTTKLARAMGLLAMLLLPAGSGQSTPRDPASAAKNALRADRNDWQKLSRAERAAQLMIVGVPGPVLDRATVELLRRLRPGGICLYAKNFSSEEQLRLLIADVRGLYASGPTPLIAVDEEGGVVSRVGLERFGLPGAMALGATRSAPLAERAGAHLARELLRLGIDINFAPVLELATNPASRTIGVRAFSDDPDLATSLGAAFVRGQRAGGIVSVAKHFPGHGEEQVDSHSGVPSLAATSWHELDREVATFRRVMHEGNLEGVMMAHAVAPALTGNAEPVTVSAPMISQYLKSKLRFDGVVITDVLSMEAIARALPAPVAAKRAIAAGADMVLVPWGQPELVREYIERAIVRGEIPGTRVEDALRRIFALRSRQRRRDSGDADGGVIEEVARGSVTLLKNHGGILPLRSDQRITIVTTSASFLDSALRLRPRHSILLPSTSAFPTSRDVKETPELAHAVAAARAADVVVVALINDEELFVLRAMLPLRKPVVLVSLGRPLLLDVGRHADALVAAYSYRPAATGAVVDAIAGVFVPAGRLPVRLPHFPRGTGLNGWGDPDQLATPATHCDRAACPEDKGT